ncbi:MAG: DUF420 domain-containing protein, partial [Planctomycetaceae bacterium]|nr:DUF420 domain-containing protein [Planctomycetaceae bacterium]
RQLGKITVPIWLYVSVTGVVIYFMVYVLFPSSNKQVEAAVFENISCRSLV